MCTTPLYVYYVFIVFQVLEKRIAELNSVNKEYEKLKKIVSQARSVELGILVICGSAE